MAIVRKIDKFEIIIETYDKKKGVINYEDIDWTRKEFNEILKVGDVIYVEKKNEGIYSLKQLPKANGGIVVMDPFSGRVLALSGGFSFKKVNLIESPKHSGNQDLLLNHLYML